MRIFRAASVSRPFCASSYRMLLMVSFSPETRVLFKISFRMAVYILSLTVELLAFICVIPFFAVAY